MWSKIKRCIKRDFYGGRLVSFVLFGSVARDAFRSDSDIDILIIAHDLPRGRIKRVEEFEENIEEKLTDRITALRTEGIFPSLSPLFKTPNEVVKGSPLFLDMVSEAELLYDRDGFFKDYLHKLKGRLTELGAQKVRKGGGWYWVLKPDYKPGDVIEL